MGRGESARPHLAGAALLTQADPGPCHRVPQPHCRDLQAVAALHLAARFARVREDRAQVQGRLLGGADQGVDLFLGRTAAPAARFRGEDGELDFFAHPVRCGALSLEPWILGFRQDPHLLCRVTLDREPPQKRSGIRGIQFRAGWGASPLISCLSFSIYRGGRSLLEAPVGSDIL